MKLTSLAFGDKLPVPSQYTCSGPNVSPPFEFLDVPKQTESLALIVEDVDSPNQWIHWLVYNIPAHITHFDEGKIAEEAIDGVCNGGTHGYQGPCAKHFSGIRRYSFRLYALDKMLDVPPSADSMVVEKAMEGHIIEQAELIGLVEGEMA